MNLYSWWILHKICPQRVGFVLSKMLKTHHCAYFHISGDFGLCRSFLATDFIAIPAPFVCFICLALGLGGHAIKGRFAIRRSSAGFAPYCLCD